MEEELEDGSLLQAIEDVSVGQNAASEDSWILSSQNREIQGLWFSNDGKLLVSKSGDGQIDVWQIDGESPFIRGRISCGNEHSSVAYLAANKILAISCGQSVVGISTNSWRSEWRLDLEEEVEFLASTFEKNSLLTIEHSLYSSKRVLKVWDTASKTVMRRDVLDWSVFSVSTCERLNEIAVIGTKSQATEFSILVGSHVSKSDSRGNREIHWHVISTSNLNDESGFGIPASVTMSPNGESLLAVFKHGLLANSRVILWHKEDDRWEPVSNRTIPEVICPSTKLFQSKGGLDCLVAVTDFENLGRWVTVYEGEAAYELHGIDPNRSVVSNLEISPNGTMVAAGDSKGSIWLWRRQKLNG